MARLRWRSRCAASTPQTRSPSRSGTAMKDTVSFGSRARSTERPRKSGSVSMSCTTRAMPVRSTPPQTPSPRANTPRAASSAVSPYQWRIRSDSSAASQSSTRPRFRPTHSDSRRSVWRITKLGSTLRPSSLPTSRISSTSC